MDFYNEFKLISNNQFNYLRVNKILYSENKKLKVTFVVPNGKKDEITVVEYNKIVNYVNLVFDGYFEEINIEFIESKLNNLAIFERVKHFFRSKEVFVLASLDLENGIHIDIENAIINIIIDCETSMVKYIEENFVVEKLKNYLTIYIAETINITINDIGDTPINLNLEEKKFKRVSNIRTNTFEIAIREPLKGHPMVEYAEYIKKFKEKGKYLDVNITGLVVEFKQYTAKSSGNVFYKGIIDDRTGRMPFTIFTRSKKTNKAFDDIQIGDTLLLNGKIEYSQFDRTNSMIVDSMAYCDILNFENASDGYVINNILYDEYNVVKPVEYQDTESVVDNIFDVKTDIGLSKNLLNKEYVVFDLETTGTDVTSDKIVEISAVKIRNGVIVEEFSTLVNPKRPIPKGASDVNNITDDMVESSPYFEDVVGDFFKFTYGIPLVAHNIGFDYPLLNYEAKACGYRFENDLYDTLALSRKYLDLPNYKLMTICDSLHIFLENAHRALNDSVACAKVFIYIANNFDVLDQTKL